MRFVITGLKNIRAAFRFERFTWRFGIAPCAGQGVKLGAGVKQPRGVAVVVVLPTQRPCASLAGLGAAGASRGYPGATIREERDKRDEKDKRGKGSEQ